MIVWIKNALVLAIHERQVTEHGGSLRLRDENLLESALARPQQLYAYGDPPPDLADLAASLASGLARNHAFLDGNKPTAAVACETFIEFNGSALEASDVELFPLYLALMEGKPGEKELAAWLRAHLVTRNRGDVHESGAAHKSGRKRSRRKSGSGTKGRAQVG